MIRRRPHPLRALTVYRLRNPPPAPSLYVDPIRRPRPLPSVDGSRRGCAPTEQGGARGGKASSEHRAPRDLRSGAGPVGRAREGIRRRRRRRRDVRRGSVSVPSVREGGTRPASSRAVAAPRSRRPGGNHDDDGGRRRRLRPLCRRPRRSLVLRIVFVVLVIGEGPRDGRDGDAEPASGSFDERRRRSRRRERRERGARYL